jgi:glucose-6-phosphate isomerase
MSVTRTKSWHALTQHRDAVIRKSMRELFAADAGRFDALSVRLQDFVIDCSKQHITAETLGLLTALARERNLGEGIARMVAGEPINHTERRAALHIALRSERDFTVAGTNISPAVRATRQRVLDLAEAIRRGEVRGATGKPIRRVVNVGIGGSDLGPRMATRALGRYTDDGLRVDYVANVDPTELAGVLRHAVAEETAFVVSSKTFSTLETLANAHTARTWLVQALGSAQAAGQHFFAVSNNLAATQDFHIDPARCFEMPEWVGGRYSMWSAIGLPLACAVGAERFAELLDGAREMDEHFLAAPFERNLPVIAALVGIWNIDFLGADSLAVLPYSHALGDLPSYLQQLDMESNGKRVTADGTPVECATAPILWGASGTVGQHAYHQLLYQGTRRVAIDFIVPVGDARPEQQALVANALAQSAALMLGKTEAEAGADLRGRGVAAAEADRLAPHVACPGNQPSSTIVFPDLTPRQLGRLIALYEHKVFVQGHIWGVNSFDQYGVELGKQMARAMASTAAGATHLDASTAGLMKLADDFRRGNA